MTQINFINCVKSQTHIRSKNQNHLPVYNMLLFLEKGTLNIHYPPLGEHILLQEGDLFFLPKAYPTCIETHRDLSYVGEPSVDLARPFFPLSKAYYQKHNKIIKGEEARYMYLHFDAKVLGVIDIFNFLNIPPVRVTPTRLFQEIIEHIFEESRANKIGSKAQIKVYTQLLVVHLFRYVIEKKIWDKEDTQRVKSTFHPKIERVLAYIGKYLDSDLSNQQLAKKFGFSHKYIGQFFKSAMQINLQEYISILRLQRAAEEFLTYKGERSIKHVSKKVGYSNFSYFCKNFKKYWGITAGEMCRRFQRLEAQQKSANRSIA